MDFNDTPDEAAYRGQVAVWLDANVGEYRNPPATPWDDAEFVARAKAWQAKKFAAGYVAISWDEAVSGQGLSPMHQIIYHQEEARFHAPTTLYTIGFGMCLPTVTTHGSAGVVGRYLPPALRGDEVWCQLFSEPGAGSDLAGVRTRAVRDGDEWVVDGQKVWSTHAHLADFGILLCRTDPSQPKHQGLTMFIVDMRAQGVDVRPLRQMSGQADFNEVFLSGVRIPDSHRLGAEGNGWKVALTTLMNERLAVGGKPSHSPGYVDLIALARSISTGKGAAIAQTHVRERIAATYIADEGTRLTQLRALSALSRGEAPGAESSISKVVVAKTMQDTAAFALDLLQNEGFIVDPDDSALSRWQESYVWSAGFRIAGGTDEILRNIIAERVLGLPGDMRPDKNLPFSAAQNN